MDLSIANQRESKPSRPSVAYTIESNCHTDKYITIFKVCRSTVISFLANQLFLSVAVEYLEASHELATTLVDHNSIDRQISDLSRFHFMSHCAHLVRLLSFVVCHHKA